MRDTFFLWELLSFIFLDKPYQEINFKSHLNSVVFCKQGKILSYFHMYHVILFLFTFVCKHFYNENEKVVIIKVIQILIVFCDQ